MSHKQSKLALILTGEPRGHQDSSIEILDDNVDLEPMTSLDDVIQYLRANLRLETDLDTDGESQWRTIKLMLGNQEISRTHL
jgi:hypothetical protein